MIKIAVPGANGRMGNMVANLVVAANDMELALATVQDEQYSKFISNESCGFNVSPDSQLQSNAYDVMIDFTLPNGVMKHVDYCVSNTTPMVIGSTGFTSQQFETINAASEYIPILYSANMSVGINIVKNILNSTKHALEDFAVTIHDIHHVHKKDAPSGTARMLQSTLLSETRDPDSIRIISDRVGEVVGDHSITFKSPDEEIIITHRALDRKVFAAGAIVAARWLVNKCPGLYSLEDVLNN